LSARRTVLWPLDAALASVRTDSKHAKSPSTRSASCSNTRVVIADPAC
jgi:hypothetical protein